MSLKFSSSGLSDIGLVRSNNEDSWGEYPRAPFWVLADGMGGHQAGEVASKEAVEATFRLIGPFLEQSEITLDSFKLEVEKSIELVNSIVYAIGISDERLRGMGTTLVCLAFLQGEAVVAHVGDSRAYLMRDGELKRLTTDHTLAMQLLEKGQIDRADASLGNYRNVITKAIGNGQILHPTLLNFPLKKGDRFLLASDGLTDMIEEKEIASILKVERRLSDCTSELIDEAKRQGGVDNITAVVVQVDET